MKKLLYFIIPVLIGVVFAFGLNKFLDNEINKLYQSKNLVPLKNQYSTNIKDKGILINNHFLEQGNIMMIGSSELNHSIAVKNQHPSNIFNTNRSKDGVFIIGRANTQTLQDALVVGSTDSNIKNKKIVLLLSMQWFMGKEGIKDSEFQGRFSPAQFYTFFNNKKISNENKKEMAERVATLLNGSEEYKPEREYALLYNSNTVIDKVEKMLLYPYFKLREKMVILKEKGLLYLDLKNLENKTNNNEKLGKPFNWDNEYKRAVKDAEVRSNKNKYKINDWYYNTILKHELPNLKNKYSNVKLLESEEIHDYQYFLDICKNLGVKPTIVVMPGSRWFYNYTGMSQEERYKYYDKVTEMAKEKGFNVINLKDKENTEYYLRDVMHLGTKGWLDVNEKLYKEYNEGQIFNK
ncbi:D-alanyl-lipoteichoic acid biosynthesis protein DltD [Clostridium sardiniense]|uniref:D-alanyl-lipoteichoic acid biosynthesis protein DltD n=1 Tax=Clostridium sardiniense TaxID=29369 RepID=UPI00195EC489|nr:D-alanyl-lipoteichoic acid biosynthesis protein DltD [Clostridium sardiniense]MBM7833020.1 D-alanine transfer protein [Clostridium sardiniense]